jgi:hypothetical protein
LEWKWPLTVSPQTVSGIRAAQALVLVLLQEELPGSRFAEPYP